MLKKTITYTDFNGDTQTEDFYFHLSKAELVELELSEKGGFAEMLQSIVEAEDGKTIIAKFKELILKAYGVRSEDGRRFIKNDKLSEEFSQTEAYSQLFIELATDADHAATFMKGVVPSDVTVDKPLFPSIEGKTAVAEREVIPLDQLTADELRARLAALEGK